MGYQHYETWLLVVCQWNIVLDWVGKQADFIYWNFKMWQVWLILVCISFEQGDTMLTLLSMETLIVHAGQKYCRMLSWSILQYFWPALSYRVALRHTFCLFWLAAYIWKVSLYKLICKIRASIGHMMQRVLGNTSYNLDPKVKGQKCFLLVHASSPKLLDVAQTL